MNKKFGIYEVSESFTKDGLWQGYRCAVVTSTGKQGKLYIPKDGRLHYQAKKDEDEGLEI